MKKCIGGSFDGGEVDWTEEDVAVIVSDDDSPVQLFQHYHWDGEAYRYQKSMLGTELVKVSEE